MQSDLLKIKFFINDWDPLNLMSHAPSDEYDGECEKIMELFKRNQQNLDKIIYAVFVESFGRTSFNKSIGECEIIAKKILDDSNLELL